VTSGDPDGKILLTQMSSSGSRVPPVVGRQDELADLDRFLAAGDGLPAALVLEGEAGIGKTTLWRNAVAAASDSYRVLSAQPVAAEAELSHAALADLLELCIADVLPELPRPQQRALEGALLLAEPEAVLQPRAVAAGFLGVLRALARERPVLVALDDIHWLDTSSRAVLEFAFRRLRNEAVAVLVSVRADAEERSLAFGPAFEAERLTRIRLGGLDMQAVQALLRERLGLTLTRPTLLQVVDASGGNPFFALELGRTLDRRAAPIALSEPLPVPATLKELVARRLALLPARTLDVLGLAALAGDCPVDLLARALNADPSELLRPAIDAEVIEVTDDRVRFTHPLLASVSRAAMEGNLRRDAHRRLATAVTDPEQRARHLALAAEGPDPSIASALDGAAGDASRRGAPGAAAELARLAAELTPPDAPDQRADRLITAAELHRLAGEHTATRELLEPLVDALPAGRRRARALFCLGWTEAIGRGRELCSQALDEADGAFGLTAAIRHVLGYVELVAGRLNRAREQASAAVHDAQVAGDRLAYAHGTSLLFLVDFLAGRGAQEDALAEALALEQEIDAVPRPTPPSVVHALRLMYLDRFDEARDAFAHALRRAANRGDEEMVEAVLFHSARLELRAGDWARVASLADQISELGGQDLGHRSGLRAWIRAQLAAHEGHESAAALAAAAVTAGGGLEIRELEMQGLLGFLELSRGHAAESVRLLEPLPRRLRELGYGEPSHLQAIPNLVEAYVDLGRPDDARPLLEWYERRSQSLDHPLGLAQAARCSGLLAAAEGDVDAAVARFDAALALQLPEPLEHGRTLLARGIVLRRAKRRRDARNALDEACALFDRLGALRWAERARGELARVAGRPPSRENLTVTESRVADLVAEGRSNKEVAAALFVTVKGVEAHLSRIYRKLGVKSRAELMRLYATRGAQ
jgi:DNA-binding CsgD family transcriptional regulator